MDGRYTEIWWGDNGKSWLFPLQINNSFSLLYFSATVKQLNPWPDYTRVMCNVQPFLATRSEVDDFILLGFIAWLWFLERSAENLESVSNVSTS